MTDSPNGKGLSRRVVATSFAINMTGFLGLSMIGFRLTSDDPLFGLISPA